MKKIILAVAILIIAAYCILVTPSDKLHGGVYINGINCSFKTFNETSKMLEDNSSFGTVKIMNENVEIANADIGSAVTISYPAEKIKELNKKSSFIEKIAFPFIKFEYQMQPSVSINKTRVAEIINGKNGQVYPESAYVKYKGGKFVIIPETSGDVFDENLAADIIAEELSNNPYVSVIDISKAHVIPGTTKEDAKLVEKCENLNKEFSFKIEYIIDGSSTILEDADIYEMYIVDENGIPYEDDGYYAINKKAVSRFLNKHNIYSQEEEDWLVMKLESMEDAKNEITVETESDEENEEGSTP